MPQPPPTPTSRPDEDRLRRPAGQVLAGTAPPYQPPPIPSATTSRPGEERIRRAAGQVLAGQATPPLPYPTGTWYSVYSDAGTPGTINYGQPLAQLQGVTSWSTSTLSPGPQTFAVRAADPNGEEQNLDAAALIILDENGNDITARPAPPIGTRAFPTAGGGARIEWAAGMVANGEDPTQYRVYLGIGSPDYSIAVAVVPCPAAFPGGFVANITGLEDGVTYQIAVRASNASGEETNLNTVSLTANATGPMAVDSLTAQTI